MFNKTQFKPLRVVKIESVNPKSDDSLMLHAQFVVVSKGHMAIPFFFCILLIFINSKLHTFFHKQT